MSTHSDATPPNASSRVSTLTHSAEEKEAGEAYTDENTLEKSTSNPILAVDPSAQEEHVGSDVHSVTDFEKGPNALEEQDPNIVDFHGPDDPDKAVNWPARQKYSMLALISVMTFITYAANIQSNFRVPADLVPCQAIGLVHVCPRGA